MSEIRFQRAELIYPEGLTWQDHPDVSLARDLMPMYEEFADGITPMEFIKQYWDEATPGLRLQMIEYMEGRPFPGCDRYIEQWEEYLERNRDKVLSLI